MRRQVTEKWSGWMTDLTWISIYLIKPRSISSRHFFLKQHQHELSETCFWWNQKYKRSSIGCQNNFLVCSVLHISAPDNLSPTTGQQLRTRNSYSFCSHNIIYQLWTFFSCCNIHKSHWMETICTGHESIFLHAIIW